MVPHAQPPSLFSFRLLFTVFRRFVSKFLHKFGRIQIFSPEPHPRTIPDLYPKCQKPTPSPNFQDLRSIKVIRVLRLLKLMRLLRSSRLSLGD